MLAVCAASKFIKQVYPMNTADMMAQVGDVDNNLNRADAVLSRGKPEDLDLLVLPELAFTGRSDRVPAIVSYP